MARRKNKKSKRRLAIFGTVSLIIIVYSIFNLCYYSYKIAVLEKTKKDLQQQLTNLQEQEETLTTDIQKLKDPEYIAKYARENYMYSRDGEYILKIEDEEKNIEETKDSIDYKYLLTISSIGFIIIILYVIKRKKQ